MKNKTPWVHAHIPQYDFYVIGLLGWSREAAKEFMRKKYPGIDVVPFSADGSSTIIEGMGKRHVIIHTQMWNNKPRTLALLLHEVIHTCLQIYDSVGQGICTKDHEHLTYLAQYIFQILMEKRNGRKKEKSTHRRKRR